jgi:hypothetical protein
MLASAGGMQGYGRFHPSETYVHEVLHLLALHTALQLALLSGVQPIAQLWSANCYFGHRVQCAACLLAAQANDHEADISGESRGFVCDLHVHSAHVGLVCDLWIWFLIIGLAVCESRLLRRWYGEGYVMRRC